MGRAQCSPSGGCQILYANSKPSSDVSRPGVKLVQRGPQFTLCDTHSVCLRQQNIKKQILKQLQACLTGLWISVLFRSIISPKVSWQTVQESPLAHA